MRRSLIQTWPPVLLAFYLFAAGFASWHINYVVPAWVEALGPKIRPMAWHRLVGVSLMAVGITTCFVCPFLAWYRAFLGLEGNPEAGNDKYGRRRVVWPATIVGMAETIIYAIALHEDKGEFIGVWVAIKVAAQWGYWNDKPGEPIEGRARFYVFLTGNLCAIVAGFLTYRAMLAAMA